VTSESSNLFGGRLFVNILSVFPPHAFMKANVPCINEVREARVSSIRPLKIHDFGFIYLDKSVMIGQGARLIVFSSCSV